MALFMNRLGKALTPRYLYVEESLASLDPDANPIICQTASYTPAFPQRARLEGVVSISPTAAMSVAPDVMFSTNSGAAWSFVTNFGTAAGAQVAGLWFQAASHGNMALNANQAYMFGLLVARSDGLGTGGSATCHLNVTITNRNADGENPEATAPLRRPARPMRRAR
jgi:hypothetical protein